MIVLIKRTVSRDFSPLFLSKILPGPLVNRLKRFCELFWFREGTGIRLQMLKLAFPLIIRIV